MLFSGFLSNWIHSCHPQVLSSNGSPPKSRQGWQRPKTVWKHPFQNIAKSFHRFLGLLNTFLASIWLLNQCRPSWWPNAVIKMIFWPLAASDSRNVHLWFLNMKIPHKCGWLAKEWSQYFKMSYTSRLPYLMKPTDTEKRRKGKIPPGTQIQAPG